MDFNIEFILGVFGAIIAALTVYLTYRQYKISSEDRRDKEIQDFKDIYEVFDRKVAEAIFSEKINPCELFGNGSEIFSSGWATKPKHIREKIVKVYNDLYNIISTKDSSDGEYVKKLCELREKFAEDVRTILKIEEYEKRGKNFFLDIWMTTKYLFLYLFYKTK